MNKADLLWFLKILLGYFIKFFNYQKLSTSFNLKPYLFKNNVNGDLQKHMYQLI